MIGAREYAKLFSSAQYGKLRIVSGSHARGRTFHIYVGQRDNEVEVYGVVGGTLGWSEHYGWKHKGRWEKDFTKEIEKRKKEIVAQLATSQGSHNAITRREHHRITSILEAY